MTDRDRPGESAVSDDAPAVEPPSDAPTVSCRRCSREWTLEDELETVGNRAFEQFALDHQRHTGHFPDGVEPWRATCRHCPEEVVRLDEAAARRWAETHARHTRHRVAIRGGWGENDDDPAGQSEAADVVVFEPADAEE